MASVVCLRVLPSTVTMGAGRVSRVGRVMQDHGSRAPARLDEIGTEWAIIHDPARFVQRYAPAVESYLRALIKNPHDAEDAAQDFFMRVAKNGFVRARQERGRFRDYLRT